jgi:acetolactate synthase-1/2/3 large subunit
VARGLGVPATRAETTTELTEELRRSLTTPGPSLIEAVLPALF